LLSPFAFSRSFFLLPRCFSFFSHYEVRSALWNVVSSRRWNYFFKVCRDPDRPSKKIRTGLLNALTYATRERQQLLRCLRLRKEPWGLSYGLPLGQGLYFSLVDIENSGLPDGNTFHDTSPFCVWSMSTVFPTACGEHSMGWCILEVHGRNVEKHTCVGMGAHSAI